MVVVAHRAHREAARAVAEGAHHAQEALPEAEEVARLQHRRALERRRIDDALHELQHGHEAEFLRLGGAGALVDAPVLHRVGRARVQAAAARFADADLLGDALVGLELELGEDAGQVHARAELGREDVDLQPERAEPRLDAEVARREPAVAGALVAPVGLLRRGDEGRVAEALELARQAVGDLVHLAQHQHVHVLHRHVGLRAERAGGDALHQHDHALHVRARCAPGVCGQRGSGGKAFSVAAEAMPARSAPSSRARRFTAAASGMPESGGALGSRGWKGMILL